MSRYEYTAIPAPQRGDKVRGAKTPGDRFAQSLTAVLNDMAERGWEYVRAETLPSEERSGLTGRTTVWHNLLIFRRGVRAAPALEVVTPAARPPVTTPAPLPPVPPVTPARQETPAEFPAAPTSAPAPAPTPVRPPAPVEADPQG
ncbi:DUF4177 domain-containing protein [Paracoccus suum]|uniref:DUF4177 domain-containing protein n=1 Tax=Paracoccus suum TaxID=2259340 RepID=UPI0018EF6087|nr:DUF4177 domain-containing protein [Paracoccus suum]